MPKHVWMTYGDREGNEPDPDIDYFAYQGGKYHNGPGCKVCGAAFCQHCHSERLDEECPGKKVENDQPGHDDKNLDPTITAMFRRPLTLD